MINRLLFFLVSNNWCHGCKSMKTKTPRIIGLIIPIVVLVSFLFYRFLFEGHGDNPARGTLPGQIDMGHQLPPISNENNVIAVQSKELVSDNPAECTASECKVSNDNVDDDSSAKNESDGINIELSNKDELIVREWLEATDSLLLEAYNNYSDLSEQQLTLMARDGDHRAIRMLGDKMMEVGLEDEALQHYKNAVMRGSVAAGERLQDYYFNRVMQTRDREKQLEFIVESGAWREFLMARGNKLFANTIIYPMRFDAKLYERIVERGSEIYLSVIEQRIKAGLDDFPEPPNIPELSVLEEADPYWELSNNRLKE